MERMRHLSREEMILIFFNGKNKVIKELTVSVGTVNQTVASPRELFLEALRCEAAEQYYCEGGNVNDLRRMLL